jgi:hypothetical protein
MYPEHEETSLVSVHHVVRHDSMMMSSNFFSTPDQERETGNEMALSNSEKNGNWHHKSEDKY